MNNLNQLQPQGVWKHFYSLTQIPRPSGHTKEVSDFLVQFGHQLGLETIQEPIGNVIIRKPASKGYEDHPAVILQGHLDMVPQKTDEKVHDFEKDPINAYVDGEWVTADGTTLGADDGMGVAAAMAILADDEALHPAIEAFFTVDEETGMYGANALEAGVLKGSLLINLDSETEGELYIGCAGGVDTTAKFAYTPVAVEEGDIALKIILSGLKGGHSGCDIHLQRANAIKQLFRFLKQAVSQYEARLVSVNGGNLRNAIPRTCEAIVTIPAEGKEEFIELVEQWEDELIREYDGIEDNIRLEATEVTCPATEMPEDVQDFLIHAITICPHGVYRMIPEMPEVVETSNNLSAIATENNVVNVLCLTRSSVEARKEELQEIIQSTFSLAGAEVEFSGAYPGWKPNFKSRLLKTMQAVYEKEFGKAANVITIHAGLECALFSINYPHLDMISFGPTIEHPHSPDERVNIETVDKMYRLLKATLKAL